MWRGKEGQEGDPSPGKRQDGGWVCAVGAGCGRFRSVEKLYVTSFSCLHPSQHLSLPLLYSTWLQTLPQFGH